MSKMEWRKPEDETPELIPVDKDTNVARSKQVLCYHIIYHEYSVDIYLRGGCGDDSTLWWGEGRTPDYWAYIIAPKH